MAQPDYQDNYVEKIQTLLLQLYDHETAATLLPEILALIGSIPASPPKAYTGSERNPEWYRTMQLYVTYPDSFVDAEGNANFDTLKAKLDHIQGLGCNAIHVLPFLESPMVDKGFDVMDYYNVKAGLGGNEAFFRFLNDLQGRGMVLFMDLIFNHVSEKHPWVLKAQSGDSYFRQFFITSATTPVLLERFSRDSIEWARYLIDGQEVEINIAFPDQVGELPHWVHARDGHWYFHSFYPQQLDLNWYNPEVLKELLKVLVYWAKLGLNFRFDAILSVFKKLAPGQLNKTPQTYKMLQLSHQIMKTVSPFAVILPETLDYLDMIHNTAGKDADNIQADLIYNFELCSKLWLAVVLQSAEPIWQVLDKYFTLPEWTQLVNFLRNHDELNIELLSKEERVSATEALLDLYNLTDTKAGITGRTATFLDEDARKIVLIYLLLCSIPGSPAIVYGDEVGKANDLEYAEAQLKLKLDQGFHNVQLEHRDIARGQVNEELINTAQGQFIYSELSEILKLRESFGVSKTFSRLSPDLSKNIFALQHTFAQKEILVYVNLGTTMEMIVLPEGEYKEITNINNALLLKGKLILPSYAGLWVERLP